jgi:hypothetical protein
MHDFLCSVRDLDGLERGQARKPITGQVASRFTACCANGAAFFHERHEDAQQVEVDVPEHHLVRAGLGRAYHAPEATDSPPPAAGCHIVVLCSR